MSRIPPLPRSIGTISVPQDRVSAGTWAWAHRRLPAYLVAHSVRSYCWGVALATRDGLHFEPAILWPASLIHDVGLTRIGRASRCFEYEGASIARRFLLGEGMRPADADRVARAIELHMAPGVTLADGAEAFLLDRATGVDVRGSHLDAIESVRDDVVRAFPRGSFDRRFVAALRREVAVRPGCESERLLAGTGLEVTMARSGWRQGAAAGVGRR